MSVAFRRDSDEEHLEPRFELPIPPGPNLVTPRGLALIGERIEALEAALAATDDAEARAPIGRDLRYWQTRRATAEPAPPPEPGVAGIGSRVRLRHGGRERAVTIVGHDEADARADRIGFAAPLARALIGLSAGDRADFAGREEAIELLAVEP